MQAELVRALHRGPGRRRLPRRLPRHRGRRPGHRRVRGDHRRGEGGRRRRQRPLRQARRERPGLERAGEARGDRPGHVRRLLRQRPARAGLARPGSARPTRSPRRSTSSAPAARRRTRTATTTSGSCRTTTAARYPAHVHLLSPVLTLQGAVAHSDMPVESGPTMYLPYSHQYAPGYLAWRLPAVPRALPRARTSSCRWPRATRRSSTRPCSTAPAPTSPPTSSGWPTCCRCSSAFGRAMETVDRSKVVRAVYPVLRARRAAGADPAVARERGRRVRRGLPVPDQPRPRRQRRRPDPAEPGRDRDARRWPTTSSRTRWPRP